KGKQAEALQKLGIALAQAQQWTEVCVIISNIQYKKEQVDILQLVAIEFVHNRRWAEACEIINYIQKRRQKAPSQKKTVQTGHSSITSRDEPITNSDEPAKTLKLLAATLVQTRQWEEVRKVVNCIQDREHQALVLQELGNLLASTNEYAEL